MRPLLFLSLCLLNTGLLAAGKELEGERAAASAICPTPEEARAKMTVPEGYEVRCFAHEPMVQNPVAMTWDHRGRLWIVEAYEYPEGTPLLENQRPFGGEAKDDQYHPIPPQCLPASSLKDRASSIPRDRVIILEDTNNDGEADKRTVFVEGLNLASAILCGDNGIYVGQQPHLIHFRDDNGDDKPDAWRVVLTGFGREDTHELVNSFTWGPDGWLYMTHGVFTNSKVRRPGLPESEGFKFDAGIGRARPTSREKEGAWEFEVFADGTSNPWGCDYDAAGNFFVSACVIDHFFHMAPGGIYVRQGGAPENPYAYELLPSIVKHKHFRAAYAGIQIYQGGRYPADTHGHAFIGNIHDNAIHEEVLTPVGATFKCEPRRDFLRANNGWFRPVSTQTGPDGFLWIMDWCDKYPCYQNAKANPEGVDRERGRIWRVVHDGAQASRVPNSASSRSSVPKASDNPAGERTGTASGADAASSTRGRVRSIPTRDQTDLDLKKLPTADLVKTLEHPNNWMRRMARRMLVERLDDPVGKELSPIVLDDKMPLQVRLEAFWTLFSRAAYSDKNRMAEFSIVPITNLRQEGKKHISESLPMHSELMKAKEPELRTWAARAYGEIDLQTSGFASGGVSLSDNFILLASDDSPIVRAAVASALRRISGYCLTTNTLRREMHFTHWNYLPDFSKAMSGLIMKCEQNDDPLTPFLVWQALETKLDRGHPRFAKNDETTDFFGDGSKIKVRNKTAFYGDLLMTLAAQLKNDSPIGAVLSVKTTRRLCDVRVPEAMDDAVRFCERLDLNYILLAHALDGLVKGQEGGVIKPTKDVSASLAKWRSNANTDVQKHAQTLAVLWGDEAAVKEMIVALHDAKKPEKERITVLQSLRKVKTNTVKEGLKPLLAPQTSTALAVAAIRAAADLGGDDFIAPLIQQAASKDFNVRIAALEALSSRTTWTQAMLDAIAAEKVSASGFPAPVRRALATSKDKAIRDQAFKVLGAWQDSSDDVKALIAAKKQACLTGEPDLANGKLIFTATCMVCHEFHGGGQKVGPDLIGSGRSNLDAILANVIDPNQIIGNGYENFTVATKDGRTLAGRVVEDTPGHVKLLGAGGATQVVPRDQVATLTNTKQSLMPMGFGMLPDATFRDLIWYILAPPEEGPLTKEKKELLVKGVEEPVAAAKPKGPSSRAIDWESVSLWNPEWKVSAPDFERTPVKLGEYYGQKNVLLMHPFPDKKTPASLERKLKVAAGKTKLKLNVAADDRGDWIVKAVVNGQVVKEAPVDHEKPRWKEIEVDLTKFTGQEVTLRLEAHASGWNMEFAYWGGITLK